jgi:hypothetical protein
VFERALAAVYLIAFLDAVNEFVPLLGARGLLPVTRFIRAVSFQDSPSLFFYWSSDTAFRVTAWTGVVLSVLVLTGFPSKLGAVGAGVVWAALWVLYLSFVNVGQIFYGFGWESLLLEIGFFSIFLGGARTMPSPWLRFIYAWMLFRLMFGAGLIKIRGDQCWRDLTCLDYYFETQPIPNPLSWYFHWMPRGMLHAGVVINHIVELGVPWLYFAPQPIAAVAAIVTMLFQGALIVSGNLSWLNWLTVVLCIPLLDDRWFSWLHLSLPPDVTANPIYTGVTIVAAAGVAFLSIGPVLNMLSSRQMMNASFNSLHLVNTYGAFGSVTRERYEIVFEGTRDPSPTAATSWQAYEFKGKPGDPSRRPRQIAPYHLRLDWLMWFEAMSPAPGDQWFFALVNRLRENDGPVTSLLQTNPFAGGPPPAHVRALYYRYQFTTPAERRRTGDWWKRQLVGTFIR